MDAPEKSGSGEESEFGLKRQCHGAYKRKRERFIPTDVPDILFIQNILSTTHPADNCREARNVIWSCLSAKCTDGRLICIKRVNNDLPTLQ